MKFQVVSEDMYLNSYVIKDKINRFAFMQNNVEKSYILRFQSLGPVSKERYDDFPLSKKFNKNVY